MWRSLRRGVATRVGTGIIAIAAVAAMALPGASATVAANARVAASARVAAPSASESGSTGDTTCVSKGMGSTCTGTYSGNTAWNPWTGTNISQKPIVTVSQTKDLTNQAVTVSWQYFTPTLGSTGYPNPGGSDDGDFGPDFYEVSIYECKGTSPMPIATGSSAGQLMGQNNLPCYEWTLNNDDGQAPAGQPNALMENLGLTTEGITYAPDATPNGLPESWGGPPTTSTGAQVTGGDPSTWKGQAKFNIEAGETNSALDCSASSPCSLVIVPNWGGNYTGTANTVQAWTQYGQCGNHSYDSIEGGGPLPASTNAYDAFGCEIPNRIIVPLSFAPSANDCPIKAPEFYAEGSPMMADAMTQWQTGWCTGQSPVTLNYGSDASEDEAREAFLEPNSALSANIDMALVTLPPDAQATQGSSRKYTYAPLANSGVAIAYKLNDVQTGRSIQHVVLDQRLMAKLTTLSYSLAYGCTVQPPSPWPPLQNSSLEYNPSETCDPAVAKNTTNLFDDNEFLALNKNCQPAGQSANYVCNVNDFPFDGQAGVDNGDFVPTVLGAFSDMTYQLTDWIGSNSEAAAFLSGQSDPWGMHVNTYYEDTVYPTQEFSTKQDPGTTYPIPLKCDQGDCASAEDYDDATMQNVWNPVTPLGKIPTDLLLDQPTAESDFLNCPSTEATGTCTQLDQLDFPSVSPQSALSQDVFSEIDLGDAADYEFPTAALVNGAGKAVTPTQASVEAAVKDMKTNPDGITQYANESSDDPAAYPLAMVDYAMVPTCGLSSSTASAIADFLDKAATTGQVQGSTPGELAAGYYPLTSAQRAQTLKAAQEVKSQDCKSAPPDKTVSGRTNVDDVGNPSKANTPTGTSPNPGSSKSPNRSSTPGASSSPSTAKVQTEAFGQKSPDSGLAGILLLLAIICGALLLVGGPTAWVLTATGKWPVVLRWLQPVVTRLRAARAWLRRPTPSGRA
jgi:hypothetical protein